MNVWSSHAKHLYQILFFTARSFGVDFFSILLEEEPQEKISAWAINLDWLEAKGRQMRRQEESTSVLGDPKVSVECLNALLRQTEEPVIVEVNPVRIDERMVAQQGIFLCKLFHQADFCLILMGMMNHSETPDQPVFRKLVVEKGLRINFLKHLREMNIHTASLFPGLDGFGKSLGLDLEIKKGTEA